MHKILLLEPFHNDCPSNIFHTCKYLISIFFIILPALAFGTERLLFLPDTIGTKGEIVEIPLSVDDSAEVDSFTSLDLDLKFNRNYLKLKEVKRQGTLIQSWGSFLSNVNSNSVLKIVAATPYITRLVPGSILLKLKFEVIADSAGLSSPIEIVKLLLERNIFDPQKNKFTVYSIPFTIRNGRLSAIEKQSVTYSIEKSSENFLYSNDVKVNISFSAGEFAGKEITMKYTGNVDPSGKKQSSEILSSFQIHSDMAESTFTVLLKFFYTPQQMQRAGISNESQLILGRFNAVTNEWEKQVTQQDTVANFVSTTTNKFSTWAILVDTTASVPPVPVELVSFIGKFRRDNTIELQWNTASETNNLGFEIDRSDDGENFIKVGFIEGHGTNSILQEYNFIDREVKSGKYYYRLRQIDFDGSYEYSKVIEIEISPPKNYKLEQNYPNPFNSGTTIKFNLPRASKVSLKVYNMLGQEIRTLINEHRIAGYYAVNWDSMDNQGMLVSSGIYFYRYETPEFVKAKKMILLR